MTSDRKKEVDGKYLDKAIIYLIIIIIAIIILLVYSVYPYPLILLFLIFAFFSIVILSLVSHKILEFMSRRSIKILYLDIRDNPAVILDTIIFVFCFYYLLTASMFFFGIKVAIMRTGLNLSQTDDIMILVFSLLLCYIARLSYYLRGFSYSKKIFLSTITPIAIINIILGIYIYWVEGLSTYNVANIMDYDYIGYLYSLTVLSAIVWLFGDMVIWFSKESLFEVKTDISKQDDMITQIKEQNLAIISPLFKARKRSDPDKQRDIDEILNWVYREALTEKSAYILLGQANIVNEEMPRKLFQELKKIEKPPYPIQVLLFKLEIYYLNDSTPDKIKKYYQSILDPNTHSEFELHLVASCLDDIIQRKRLKPHQENYSRIANRTIIGLEEWLNTHTSKLSPEQVKVFNETRALGIY